MSVQNGIGYLRATYNPDLHFTENSDAYANLMYPYIQDDGGNSRNVSLSIDVINQDEKFTTKNDFKEQEWVTDNRNSGNILLDQLIWGFKETAHNTRDSKALSNAFCFNDQTISIKITKQGHTQGYIDQDYLYSRNEITLSVVDIVKGQETVLTSFSGLESDLDDESRTIQWVIPEKNNTAFANYGFFGLFVFRIKVLNKFYIDARRTIQSNYEDRTTNSYLQLLTFSAPSEAQYVQSDTIDIFTSTPNASDSFEDLYDKSIFTTLDDANENPLSSDQKRAIIADQIAVLFMSQHPVVSSDITPSKIQGFGAEQAIRPQKVLEKAITYAERYDQSAVQLAQNRLFGMIANYQTFSFADEINDLFSSTGQSAQSITDPPRIIYMDESGSISDDVGVNGILFTPYVIENIHTEIMTKVPNADPYSIPLYKYSVGIDTLIITDSNDIKLDCGGSDVKVSYNIVFGEDKIDRIYYQAWLNNSTSYLEKWDVNGISREHEFDFSSSGGISCTYSGETLTQGDILTIRVTVMDIYGFPNVFERKLFFPLDHESPAITEITSFQRQDGSGLIDIFYHYEGVSDINPSNITLSYSTDNTSFSPVSTNVIGDIGLGVMPGRRRITWNPSSVLTEDDNITFMKITLTDVDGASNAGIINSSVVVVDLLTPVVAIRKLTIKEDEEMAESSSISDSSDSSFSSSSSSERFSSSSSSSSSEKFSSSSSSSSENYSESSSSENYSESSNSSSSSSSSAGFSESSSSSSENFSESSSSSSENFSESSSSSSENFSESSSSENFSSSSSSSSENFSSSSSSFGFSSSSSDSSFGFSSSSSDSSGDNSESSSSSSSENFSVSSESSSDSSLGFSSSSSSSSFGFSESSSLDEYLLFEEFTVIVGETLLQSSSSSSNVFSESSSSEFSESSSSKDSSSSSSSINDAILFGEFVVIVGETLIQSSSSS